MPVALRQFRRRLLLPFLILAAFAALALPSLASAAPTGDITGTVTQGGTPQSNLTVLAYAPGDDPIDGDIIQSTTTDGSGNYDLDLPVGTYNVLALPLEGKGYVGTYAGGATSAANASTVSVSASGTTGGTNIALVQGTTISGTITDSSGTGVGSIPVVLSDAGGNEIEQLFSDGGGDETEADFDTTSATTAPVGSYSFTDVAPGTYWLDINGSGGNSTYSEVWYGGTASESTATPITATPGSSTTANQGLTVAGAISGTVEGPGGVPFTAGGYAYLYSASGESFSGSDDSQISTANGSYSFSGLTPGTYYLEFEPDNTPSTFWADGWYNGATLAEDRKDATVITVGAGTTTPTTVDMATGGTISGTVTANGQSGGGVDVEIYDDQNTPVSGAETDGSGNYTAAGEDETYLLPGTYKVEFASGVSEFATSEGGGNLGFQFYNHATTLTGATPVTVAGSGADTPGINATLTSGGTITGKVTDASTGAGVPEILITLEDAQGNPLDYALSNSDGTYTMTGIPSGSYHLEFDPLPSIILLEAGISYGSNYQTQYYGGKQVLTGSSTVSVTGGSTTSGINAALGTVTTPGQTTTTTTTTPGPTTTTTVAGPAVSVDVAPLLASATPTISGTVKVNSKLTAKTGVWTAGTGFSYQWFVAGKAVKGATNSTFTPTAADYKKAITVAVTGKQSGYVWVTQTSLTTKAVAAGTLKSVVPTITGTAKVGHKLTAKTGTWTKGAKFTYQWYANKKAIKSATKSTFTLAAAEKSKTITIKVTGKLTGYASAAKTSKATKKVTG